MDNAFSPEDLARRRSQSKRLAWLIGSIVLLLYIAGFFVKR